MGLSELCIRRPVFATVLSLIVLLVGIVAYTRLSVREYPKIDPPVVSVQTTYKGANADIVETQVTKVLEESLAGIEGIDFMTSVSRAETSQISITFTLDREPSDAAADVRDRVSRVRGRLPDEVDEPVIRKVEADAQPTIYFTFSSSRQNAMEVTDFIERYVKDQFQTLPGVAQVTTFGDRAYSMRILLDPDRMAAYRVTVQDIEGALRRQNVEIPAGRIESRYREFSVRSETGLATPEQFDRLVLRRTAEGYLVRLSDVGHAELGPLEERRLVRFDGRTAVAIGVVKQATANPLDIAREAKAVLPRIRASLPPGMQVEVARDGAAFIRQSIDNVYRTIGEAVALVVLIIFLFLRSLRATLVPLVTIPVSLVGAFAIMYWLGFSINTLTLLAMVLAIGLVVDDAIVMVENIHRHLEMGKTPFRAAVDGAREISFAVLAMTITLAAVYVPIAFMTGKTGRLFTEFAMALAGAVLVSGFVALTASPMMCSKLFKAHERHGFLYRLGERALDGLTSGYRAALGAALRARPLVLLVGLAVAGTGYLLFTDLRSELAPFEDQGAVLVTFQAPVGSNMDFTDRYAREIERIAADIPEVNGYFTIIGFPTVSQGLVFLRLKPWESRTRSQQEIGRALFPRLAAIPGLRAFPINPPPLGQRFIDKPVQYVVETTRPYAELQQMVDRLIARASEIRGLTNIDSDLRLNTPQVRVDIDRDKAADLGIPVDEIGRTLESLIGGRQVTRFKREGRQYDVVVRVPERYRESPADLPRLYVRAAGGTLVQLSNLVKISETVAPRELNHFNQLRAATITATLGDGLALGDALAALDKARAEVLPPTVQVDYAGVSREFKESSASIYLTLVLALAFIYLVLSAQFESFRHPFVIMLTVPLSITGGLLALWLDGSTLNIYSQVGLVTLIGLITKHGILIVAFANQLRERLPEARAAVIEAATLRLRPILMTTGAMALGAVPLAVATGAGAESRQDIGLVIVGGILVGTLFTLFVIPAVYTYIAHRAPRPAGEAAQPRHAAAE